MIKKTNYFYIDESGHINNNQNVFIHGCIKTDTPHVLNEALEKLREELIDDLYFDELVERIKTEGFHATENHPDVRTQFYKLLPLLDYRSYFVVVDKNSEYFKNMKSEKDDYEIFQLSLWKLIKDRLVKNKNDRNIFYFEEIQLEKKSLIKVLDDLFKNFDTSFDFEYYIVGKEEENLAVVDYLNFVFYSILKSSKIEDRMEKNFNLINSKIGVVNIMHTNQYLSRKKSAFQKVELENLKLEFGG